MRKSNVTNGKKIGLGHNKSVKVSGKENNGLEEGIKRNIIICYGRRPLSERSLSNGISDQPVSYIEHHNKYIGRRITRGLFKSQKGTIINTDVNSAYNKLKKALLNAVEADRIEDVGLHPTRRRLASVTS